MAPRGEHRDHRFPGGYDPDFARRAVRVQAQREAGRVVLDLTPTPPHAVPTGDLFRRLRLTVTDAGGGVTHRFFGRRFRRDGTLLEEVRDDRLHVARRRVSVPVPPGTVRWELALERVAYATDEDPERDVVESALVLARGSVP